jgi:hypothetical protein
LVNGETVVTPLKDEHTLSIENKLNSLAARLSDLERRLSALEKTAGVQKPAARTSRPVTAVNVEYNYLRRSIDTAKRDYEHKYR